MQWEDRNGTVFHHIYRLLVGGISKLDYQVWVDFQGVITADTRELDNVEFKTVDEAKRWVEVMYVLEST